MPLSLMRRNILYKNKTMLIAVFIALLTTLFKLESKSYWFDETYSLQVIKGNTFFHTLWFHEPNMWLYYCILRLWTVLGTGEFTVRLLSAIFAVGSIVFIYLIGKNLYTKRVGTLAAILTSIHILFVNYAQEARSYTLLLFLISLSSYLFLLSSRNKKYFPLSICISILAVYAHIYACFVILSHLFFLLLNKNWKKAALYSIASVVLLSPLMLAPSIHSGVINWIQKPVLRNIAGTFFLLAGDFPLLFPIYMILLVMAVFKKSWQHRFLLSWLCIPIITAFIISFFKPLYESAYFLICLPPFLLLVSEALDRQSIVIKRILLGIIIILSLIRLGMWYTNNPHHWIVKNQFEDWRDATHDVTSHMQKGDVVIFYGYFGEESFKTYGKAPIVEISGDYDRGAGSAIPEPNTQLISQFHYPHVWLVLNRNTGTLFNRSKQWSKIENALSLHYHRIRNDTFYKVSVEEFELNDSFK